MTAMARVLLDHVRNDVSEREDLVAPVHGGVERLSASTVARDRAHSSLQALNASSGSAESTSNSAKWPGSWRGQCAGEVRPFTMFRNKLRSTSAMCRTSPSRDSAEGGTARSLSCSAVSPALPCHGLPLVPEEAGQRRSVVGHLRGRGPPVITHRPILQSQIVM